MSKQALSTLDFPQQLAARRKQHGLRPRALAERIGLHVVQLRRYDERGPDDELRLQFEAVTRFDAEEKQVVRSLLEGMILKHEARRWQTVTSGERRWLWHSICPRNVNGLTLTSIGSPPHN